MTVKEAREQGIQRGKLAALNCEVENSDRREADCNCKAGEMCEDCLSSAAFDAEQNARHYWDFAFLAQDMNVEDEFASADYWEAYDEGVAKGIERGIRKRLKI